MTVIRNLFMHMFCDLPLQEYLYGRFQMAQQTYDRATQKAYAALSDPQNMRWSGQAPTQKAYGALSDPQNMRCNGQCKRWHRSPQ